MTKQTEKRTGEKAQSRNYDCILDTIEKSETSATKASIGIDIRYYQAFLDDLEIPQEQKVELIETLWEIVTSFIELGFSVHPINAVQNKAQNTETALALKTIITDFADHESEKDQTTVK